VTPYVFAVAMAAYAILKWARLRQFDRNVAERFQLRGHA
jgi:hypothetical protein